MSLKKKRLQPEEAALNYLAIQNNDGSFTISE